MTTIQQRLREIASDVQRHGFVGWADRVIAIAAELEACRALEDALLAARRPVGGAARDALRSKREENDLREAYFKALE